LVEIAFFSMTGILVPAGIVISFGECEAVGSLSFALSCADMKLQSSKAMKIRMEPPATTRMKGKYLLRGFDATFA
jgi:hypothetical protein